MPAERLGLPKVRGRGTFLAVLLIDSLGTGLFAPFSLLYFHDALGLPLATVGLALSAASAFALPVAPPAGALVDRLGARRVVAAAQLLQGAGFVGYLVVNSTAALFLAALVVAVGQRAFWSSFFTLLAEITTPEERDRWYGLAGAAQNAGTGVGGLLGGAAVAVGSEAGYLLVVAANALTFFLAGLLLLWRVDEARPRHALQGSARREASESRGPNPTPGLGYATFLRDRPFLLLTAANAAFALLSIMFAVGLPVFASETLGAPAWALGALFAINTALLAATQTFVVRLLEGRRRTRALAFAALLWCGWCLLLMLALAVPASLVVPYLFAATAAFTLAELVHAPTSNALAAAASPEPSRGRYLAAFQLSWALASVLAPGLFALLFAAGPTLAWTVFAALALGAGAATVLVEGRLPAGALRSESEHT